MSHIQYNGDGELHITNITEAVEIDKSDIDRVVTVCQDSIEDNVSDDMVYSWYNMSDGRTEVEETYGGSCEYDIFEEAADEVYLALETDETVLCHCHQGTSRSISVATASLGRLLDINRSDAIDIIHHYRPRSSFPDRLLMDHARRYIGTNTDVCQYPFSDE